MGLGAIGLGSMLPLQRAIAAVHPNAPLPSPPLCLLSPAVPEGPFYLNTGLIRQDITEGRPGVPVSMMFTVVNAECVPIPNAVVDVWHCDKDGIYSGFGSQGTAGQTFLRGMQVTDANGQVQFTTIYPGWYTGRLTHLHVKIHFNNNTYVTTNLFYPADINTVVYDDPLYASNGQNTVTVAQDVELHGDLTRYNELMSSFTPDNNGGYLQSYTFGINAAVSTALPDNGTQGQVRLKQNFPNPFSQITTIRFSLMNPSLVHLDIYDAEGHRITRLLNEWMSAGDHLVDWDVRRMHNTLSPGNYLMELSVQNSSGSFSLNKVMTLVS